MLITLIIVLVIVGFVLWVLPKLALDPTIITIIRGLLLLVAVGFVVWFLLNLAGITAGYPSLK